MALTFDEATKQMVAAGGLTRVKSTLAITQDDSRTAWGQGGLFRTASGGLGNVGNSNGWNDFVMQFSDRGSSPFRGNTDQIEVLLMPGGSGVFELSVVLKSWQDAQYDVTLRPQRGSNSKMLLGWGTAIGNVPNSKALYCLSLEGLEFQIT